jgi:hypothetical protein
MAKEIEKRFYDLEKSGKPLAECFEQTAKEFGVTTDDVAFALNEAALADLR